MPSLLRRVLDSGVRGVRDPARLPPRVLKRLRFCLWRVYAARIPPPRVVADRSYPMTYLKSHTERAAVEAALAESRLLVGSSELNKDGFRAFLEAGGYFGSRATYTSYFGKWGLEKALEHYVALELLCQASACQSAAGGELTYMDVASEDSVAPDVYRQLRDWAIYRQDLTLPRGVHGERIGSDAAAIPLPDRSVDLMALHCSFEHFEGDSDVGFVAEAARLLRPGGRLVILPLYLAARDRVMVDPVVAVPGGVRFDGVTETVCVPRWWNRHGRLYSVRSLERRVLSRWPGTAAVHRIGRGESLARQTYLEYALVLDQARGSGEGP